MKILAIDPGPTSSGVVVLDNNRVTFSKDVGTEDLVSAMPSLADGGIVACEGIACYGMPVGRTTFDTCYYIGRLWQTAVNHQLDWNIVYRQEVKIHLCHSARAKDPNVRQALIDLFPATGGGSVPQVGTKKQPGPLYGVSGHRWSALAIAVLAQSKHQGSEQPELF